MKRCIGTILLLLFLLAGCTKEPCVQHIDQNKDDICDLCESSVIILVDFYCINDLHGRVLDSAAQPGIDEMTTFLEQAKKTDDHVLLLSAGDMWQGSAESNLTRGKMIVDWMNRLGFHGMALGNHEFDWGVSFIDKNAQLAEFPFLAINVYDEQTNQLASFCEPSRLVEVDGVQIGLIGAAGDNHSSIASDMSKGVYFKTGAALTQLVKAESQKLREQGADFIVYLIHDGMGSSAYGGAMNVPDHQFASYYDVSLSDGYVDLVFEGHTHQRYLGKDQHGVYHMQNRGDNTGGISHVEISIHAINGSVEVRQAELIQNATYETMEDSPMIQDLLEDYKEEIGPAIDTCGKTAHSIPGNDLRQLVADLYYMEGFARWGSEYDIALGGGFVSIRQPGYLTRGEVTYGDLLELFPFDNELVLCSISGRDLRKRFLESDNSNYFICCDESITNNIDDNATYYVVVDSYSSTYGPNRLTEVERYGEPYYARDMLANYIRNGGLN
jgi:2',3'-cyclic-nucleotide 2'-phosphodiesterase/3'-nucleotidase